MFYAFESILGRPLSQKTQEGFFRIGMFLLLSLMFFTLPSLEEARAKIVGILATPAQKIVSILLAPGSKIANLARAKSLKN